MIKLDKLETIEVLPSITLSKWQELVIGKVIRDGRLYLDIRVHQAYPNGDRFHRTKKGIFIANDVWERDILPIFNAMSVSKHIEVT